MPRPKRSKVAPSTSRVAKPTKPVTAPVPEPSVAAATLNDIYDVSDPDERVVTSARRVKRDIGQGKAVAARGRSGLKSRDLDREDSLSEPGEVRTTKIQDHAMGAAVEGIQDVDLESSSPAVEVGRRARSTPAVESSLLALGNFKRRPRQPSILGRAAAQARSSSVESDLAQDTGLTGVGRTYDSVLGNQQSRQTGTMGRTAGNIRSSSIGFDRGTPAHRASIFNLGNFKRRPRQPSILGTAQKQRQARPEYEEEEEEEEDEDDFNPDDESTPLNLSKTREITSSFSATNPRKRKLSAGNVPQSSPPAPTNSEMEEEQVIPATGSQREEDEEDHSQSSHEAPLPSIELADADPEPMSETMAPPLSSSPTPISVSPPSYRAAQRLRAERQQPRGRRGLRDRTPAPATQDSPISSPPSLTHSPNAPIAPASRLQPKGKRQAPARSTFSTAQLQALLPQRRRRGPRDPFDIASSEDEIDVSGLASDDDELTHSTLRAPPSRRSVMPRIPPSTRLARKARATPAPKTGAKQTYGARPAPTTSDKENEQVDPDDSLAPLPDDIPCDGSPENSQEMEKRVGKELKLAAKKFQEVDEWELDFEDCTASSSSPKDAR